MQRKKYTFTLIICLIFSLCLLSFFGCSKDPSRFFDQEKSYTQTFAQFTAIGCVASSTSTNIDIRFLELSGIKDLKSITVNDDTTFDVNSVLTEGRIRVILVSGDNWYLLFEGDCVAFSFRPDNLPAGKYKLRIVADKAAAEIAIKIN